jgi:hypothetical protein
MGKIGEDDFLASRQRATGLRFDIPAFYSTDRAHHFDWLGLVGLGIALGSGD